LPEKTRFGKLRWLSGAVLTSPSPNFGGWSGLALGPDGKSLLAISDAGAWMTGELEFADGKVKGIGKAGIGPLKSSSGRVLASGRERDAEGVTIVDGTPEKGTALVCFERHHRILRFDVDAKGLSAAHGSIALPAGAKRLSGNVGLESVA